MKTRVAETAVLTLVLLSCGVMVSCKKAEGPQPAQSTGQTSNEQTPPPNPDRNPYFGDEHIHTSWSVDAWVMGNRLTGPDDALKYAQGQTIKHPLGYDIKIDTPMDFMGVTDHSEYVGVTRMANTPGSALSKLPEAEPLILKDPNSAADQQKVFLYLLSLNQQAPDQAFMSPEVAGSIWQENVKIADQNNHPGKFTAFCSYEYTSQYDNRNLHRNVFFRDCTVCRHCHSACLTPGILRTLWNWMDIQRKAGNELLAISHNANLSDGWMYPVDVDSFGRPIDAAWASSRDRNERLVEIKQIKGNPKPILCCLPMTSIQATRFSVHSSAFRRDNGRVDHIHGSYARQALKDGIAMQDARGYNPYKFGMAGGSDSHNTGSPYRQDNFFGGHGAPDGTVDRRFAGVSCWAPWTFAWKTRAVLPACGPRRILAPRSGTQCIARKPSASAAPTSRCASLAAGDITTTSSMQKTGYISPMQTACPWAPIFRHRWKGQAPTFVVWAVKDPTSGNLDRIQIIKGWTKNGQSFEKIYDVVWSGDRKADKWTGRVPAIQSTVDLEKATYTNSVGSTELKTVWTDPEFDASLHAFYYARVLEIPTPRWTLIQAVKAGTPPPDMVPLTGQERAWTSPIWYTPSADARKNAAAGMTVADLKAKGATPLSDAQLKALIVGKAFWVRNNVTGRPVQHVLTRLKATHRLARRHQRLDAEQLRQSDARRIPGHYHAVQDRGRQAHHLGLAGPVLGHDLQARRHLLRRAQQRVRLRQLRDHSDTAVRRQPVDRLAQPVLDRAGADRTTETADRPVPAGGAKATRGAEEEHLAQAPGEIGAVEGDRQTHVDDKIKPLLTNSRSRSSRRFAKSTAVS